MGLAALALAPGLAVGSFLNVLAARLPLRRSVVRPRSACMSCGMELAWYDNVPLVSYAVLRGRCRHCHASISWRYPAVEGVTALLVAAAALKFGPTWDFPVAAVFLCILVAISATDLERRVIPNRIVVPGTVVLLAANTVLHPSVEWAIAGAGAGLVLLLIALAKPGGMGMGDVKLAALMGVMLGRVVPIAILLGMLAAMIPSIVLFARHGRAARKMKIPLGPFLAIGGVIGLFAGHSILHWYLGVH